MYNTNTIRKKKSMSLDIKMRNVAPRIEQSENKN